MAGRVVHHDGRVTVHHADALDVLPTLTAASVDAVVTDPPYGLEFMDQAGARHGADSRAAAGMSQPGIGDRDIPWPSFLGGLNPRCRTCNRWQRGANPCTCEAGDFPDERLPRLLLYQQWCQTWAAECLRVLKPGGHLVAFGGPRLAHRLVCAVEEAGFEVRDSIAWLYGSGFPKSRNLTGDWAGWGTALKPGHEPIVVARRPPRGPVAANVARHGTGALNIAGCRVGDDRRWPTNAALDTAAAADLDRQTDGASRYFPVFRYAGKAGPEERPRVGAVAHPTVKPVDLMRWLVRLVTPPHGLVLDPFGGSGTTAEACVLEGLRCITVEHDAAYLPLIQARLARPAQLPFDL